MSITTIEWTKRPGTIGETLNPTTGCNKVNRGCKHCYAEVMHKRLQAMGQEKYQADFLEGAVEHPEVLEIPLTWKKPRTVFVNSMSDLFHKNISYEFICLFIHMVIDTPQHTYLVLTKRPARALEFQEWLRKEREGMPELVGLPIWPPNIWLGTSCNDQKSLEEMTPPLLQCEASKLFLSYEPATGPITLPVDCNDGSGFFDWVIAGGESGPNAVPAHPNWFRAVRDQCKQMGTPFFFKQWGEWRVYDHWEGDNAKELGAFRNGIFEYGNIVHVEGVTLHMAKVGKKKAGNLLDGQLHQAFPA